MKREVQISLPELALIAGTRGILGVGIGLLVASRLSRSQRGPLGWALVGIGAASTIPLSLEVLTGGRIKKALEARRKSADGTPEVPAS